MHGIYLVGSWMDMESKQFFLRVKETCPEIIQPSWKPEETSKPAKPLNIATKFGGSSPWVSDKWKWPSCKECTKKLSFLCQVNLTDLPKKMKEKTNLSSGLFQCFYCMECSGYSDCFEEVRIVPQEDIEINSLCYLSAVASKDLDVSDIPVHLQKYVQEINKTKAKNADYRVFEEHFVGGWVKNEVLEIPTNEELSENAVVMAKLGLEPDDMWAIKLKPDADDSEDGEDEEEGMVTAAPALSVKIQGPSGGIKLGGWIDWVQGVEYPECPDCVDHPVMDIVLLQLEEDKLLDFMWGDCGVAHVTLCPLCQKPGLGWACH